MRKVTHIKLKGEESEIIQEIDDILDYKKGDKFYFGMNFPTPKTIEDFRAECARFKDTVVDEALEKIKEKCNKYSAVCYEVVKVTNCVVASYRHSISKPDIEQSRTIIVKEIETIK